MKKSRSRATAVAVAALALGAIGQQSSQAAYGPTTGGFVAGWQNNFGYRSGAVPNAFFDNSQPRDLGVFDREASDSSDQVDRWVQRFSAQLPEGFTAATVTVQLREVFSDGAVSTVTIDGITRPLLAAGDTPSGVSPVVRTITLTGADAAVADDGVLRMVFRENGDNVALDWSAVTVTDASGTSFGGLGSAS